MLQMLRNSHDSRLSSTKTIGLGLFAFYISTAAWATWLVFSSDPVLIDGVVLIESGRVVRMWNWESVSGVLTGLATLPGFATVMFGVKAAETAVIRKNGNGGSDGG